MGRRLRTLTAGIAVVLAVAGPAAAAEPGTRVTLHVTDVAGLDDTAADVAGQVERYGGTVDLIAVDAGQATVKAELPASRLRPIVETVGRHGDITERTERTVELPDTDVYRTELATLDGQADELRAMLDGMPADADVAETLAVYQQLRDVQADQNQARRQLDAITDARRQVQLHVTLSPPSAAEEASATEAALSSAVTWSAAVALLLGWGWWQAERDRWSSGRFRRRQLPGHLPRRAGVTLTATELAGLRVDTLRQLAAREQVDVDGLTKAQLVERLTAGPRL